MAQIRGTQASAERGEGGKWGGRADGGRVAAAANPAPAAPVVSRRQPPQRPNCARALLRLVVVQNLRR
jgi:hypothetical protein